MSEQFLSVLDVQTIGTVTSGALLMAARSKSLVLCISTLTCLLIEKD